MNIELEAVLGQGNILRIKWDETLVETANAGFSLESPILKDPLGLPLTLSDSFTPAQCKAIAEVLIAIATLSEAAHR